MVWDSWCGCWDTLKRFGTVGAIAGTLRNGLGQLVQLLGHSETVWDSWCNCWDTPKQFGTVGAVTGTLIQKLFFVEASTVYNYFFYIYFLN